MNAFAAYNAINTKLHSRSRAILSKEEWQKVLAYENVAQLIEFLKKQYGYSGYLQDAKVDEVHRGDLEIILHRYIVGEIESLLGYFSGPYKAFFKTLLIQYEIYDLELLLRSVIRNESIEGVGRHFVHSKKHTTMPYQKLLASKNINQVIESLKDTPYYEVLKTTTSEDLVKREFHMEMKLETLFYKMLMERAKKLEKRDQQVVQNIIGFKVDCLNIQWIYRATKYYDISKEEILVYTLAGGALSFNGLKKLVYAKNDEEFKHLAHKYLKTEVFRKHQDSFLERNLDKLVLQHMKEASDQQTIAKPLSYIYRLEIEIKDLTAATEGIRYGLDPHEIKKYLVASV